MTRHRAKLARERAGLSVGQASRILGILPEAVERLEASDVAFDATGDVGHRRLAEVYGVNREWLAGDVPRHDYAHVDQIKNADKLTSHDRDVIAEFAAAMPRETRKRCPICKRPRQAIEGVEQATCGDTRCEAEVAGRLLRCGR